MYTLVKIKIDEGKTSNVSIGMSTESSNYVVINDDVSHNLKFQDIPLDSCLLISGLFSFIRTSPISEIISCADDEIIFKTTSSTYKLTKEDNDV